MDYSQLESLTTNKLKDIIDDMGLKHRKQRTDMIDDIRHERTIRYVVMEQLGEPGKDAITYLVKVGRKKYAMKTFNKRKSCNQINIEVYLQRRAAALNISPKVIDVDVQTKYIVMEKMDRHLVDVTRPKVISLDHQKQLIQLYKTLDEIGVFHGDANPLNYMLKGTKLYAIDFGMSKQITQRLIKQLGTNYPNEDIMTLAMVLKFKNMNYPKSSYSYLVKHIDKNTREKFGI